MPDLHRFPSFHFFYPTPGWFLWKKSGENSWEGFAVSPSQQAGSVAKKMSSAQKLFVVVLIWFFNEVKRVLKLWEMSLIYQNFKLRFESQWKSYHINIGAKLKNKFSFMTGEIFFLNFNKWGHINTDLVRTCLTFLFTAEGSRT